MPEPPPPPMEACLGAHQDRPEIPSNGRIATVLNGVSIHARDGAFALGVPYKVVGRTIILDYEAVRNACTLLKSAMEEKADA